MFVNLIINSPMHLPLTVSQAFAYCIKVYVYMYRYEAGFPWKLSERERKGWGSEGVTRFFLSLYVCVCVCGRWQWSDLSTSDKHSCSRTHTSEMIPPDTNNAAFSRFLFLWNRPTEAAEETPHRHTHTHSLSLSLKYWKREQQRALTSSCLVFIFFF